MIKMEDIMKKHFTLLVVIMCLCIFACTPGEKTEPAKQNEGGTSWAKAGFQDTLALAKEQNKLIVIDFFSPT